MNKTLFRLFSLAVILALMVSFLPSRAQQVTAAAPTELFFSEYIEGSSYNKALEIYNGTGSPSTLRQVAITFKCTLMVIESQHLQLIYRYSCCWRCFCHSQFQYYYQLSSYSCAGRFN